MEKDKNKIRGQFTSSTFLRYWGQPNYLKRVNAHALRRELLLQFLIVSFNSPIIRNKNLKVDVHPICPLLYLSQPIGNKSLLVQRFIYLEHCSIEQLQSVRKNTKIFGISERKASKSLEVWKKSSYLCITKGNEFLPLK